MITDDDENFLKKSHCLLYGDVLVVRGDSDVVDSIDLNNILDTVDHWVVATLYSCGDWHILLLMGILEMKLEIGPWIIYVIRLVPLIDAFIEHHHVSNWCEALIYQHGVYHNLIYHLFKVTSLSQLFGDNKKRFIRVV